MLEKLLLNIDIVELVYYVLQIVSAIAVILGTIIALFQYVFNSRETKKQRKQEMKLYDLQMEELKKDRMQRAIDLSEYYKNNVIYYMNILKYVYDKTGVSTIMENIPDERMQHFDIYELKRNICPQDIEKLRKFKDNKDFMDALVGASTITGFWPECREDIVLMDEEGKEIKQINIKGNELRYRFGLMVQDVLNNLEYFSMALTHKTADESVIYQSLHSTYMTVVRLLYYDISSNNNPGEGKLFTNVIELYNIWKQKADQQKAEEISVARDNVSKGNELKKVDKK